MPKLNAHQTAMYGLQKRQISDMFIGMPSPTENGFVEHTFSLEIFKKSFAVTSLLKSSHVESWLDADLKDKWEFVALKQSCKMS